MKVKYAKAKHSESISIALPSITLTGAYRRLSSVDPFSINLFGTNYTISPSILDAYTTQARMTSFQMLLMKITTKIKANLSIILKNRIGIYSKPQN